MPNETQSKVRHTSSAPGPYRATRTGGTGHFQIEDFEEIGRTARERRGMLHKWVLKVRPEPNPELEAAEADRRASEGLDEFWEMAREIAHNAPAEVLDRLPHSPPTHESSSSQR